MRPYARRYAEIPQMCGNPLWRKIPVDNSKFSTFSTGLSTGVFHRDADVWIFIFRSHKTESGILEKSHFFWMVDFYQGKFFVQKLGLDSLLFFTVFGKGGGLLSHCEKNSKWGLILRRKDAIMCTRMER